MPYIVEDSGQWWFIQEDPADIGTTFGDYARLSQQKRQRIRHQGVIVTQEQEGSYEVVDGTVVYSADWVPMDVTTGFIDPVVVYPDLRTGLDIAGKIGGPNLDFDNSLSYVGSKNDVSAPMGATMTAPDHSVTVAAETTLDITNVRNSEQGEDATVAVSLSTVKQFGDGIKLDATVATFEYWDGSAYQAVTPTVVWDGSINIEFDVALASASIDTLKWRTTFASGATPEDYKFAAVVSVDGEKRSSDEDEFAVS